MYWLDALLYGSAAIVVLCMIAVMFRPMPRKIQKREYEMRNSSMSDVARGG